MSTVNPVSNFTYYLSTSNNPITFGSGTDISVQNGNGVYGGNFVSWNVTNAGRIRPGSPGRLRCGDPSRRIGLDRHQRGRRNDRGRSFRG